MRVAEIDTALVASNPWWRDPENWEESDVQLRAARQSPLSYDPRPLRGVTAGGLYILRGPRRVGKSTALKQLIAERLRSGSPPRSILHVSVEGRSAQDLVDIVRRGAASWLEGDPGERLWVIDEITGVKGAWPEHIKRLRDSDPAFSADTVVLTGSSAAKFDEARKLLAGRRNADHSDRTLFQMGFTEVARALGVELPESPSWRVADLCDASAIEAAISQYRPWMPALVDAWDHYLAVGGYPQAVAAELKGPGGHGGAVLTEALWDVIHGDAFEGAGLTHTQTQTILRSLSSSLSSLFSRPRSRHCGWCGLRDCGEPAGCSSPSLCGVPGSSRTGARAETSVTVEVVLHRPAPGEACCRFRRRQSPGRHNSLRAATCCRTSAGPGRGVGGGRDPT